MTGRNTSAMSTLEYHVLLAMANRPLYGYALKTAVEDESEQTLTPPAGTLYRVLARLMTWGLVAEVEPHPVAAPHPGRARKYYGLTAEGSRALAAEASRLKGAAAMAEERLRAIAGGR